jgi:nicotinate-nucleotide adenylyltransferase
MKKIGIFGGSFNPIHIGHLALANYLCEYGETDEIWFLVSPHNPLKPYEKLVDDNIRLKMVEKAITGYPKFKVSDFEFHLSRPSYMVNTLEKLKKKYPEKEFILIIGADNWKIFPKWKDANRIIKENKIIIYPRKDFDIKKEILPENVKLINTPLLEISSTLIRENLEKGKDLRFFIPKPVYNIIKKQHLYNSQYDE